MKHLAIAIYLTLKSLVPSIADVDEPEGQRTYRLTELSYAVSDAVAGNSWQFDEPLLAGMLLSVSWHETKLASYVWEGCLSEWACLWTLQAERQGPRCDPLVLGRCDRSPKTGLPQSLTYFQLKQRVCPELFHIPQGTAQATEEAARCAARALVGAWYRCRSRAPWGPVAGAISGYGWSSVCDHPMSRSRAYTANWMASRIRVELHKLDGT